jgi:hypothetical protein
VTKQRGSVTIGRMFPLQIEGKCFNHINALHGHTIQFLSPVIEIWAREMSQHWNAFHRRELRHAKIVQNDTKSGWTCRVDPPRSMGRDDTENLSSLDRLAIILKVQISLYTFSRLDWLHWSLICGGGGGSFSVSFTITLMSKSVDLLYCTGVSFGSFTPT